MLHLFTLWQEQLPPYKPEDLALPSVVIKSVETDKLVTYFEHTYVNVTNNLYMNEVESKFRMNTLNLNYEGEKPMNVTNDIYSLQGSSILTMLVSLFNILV